MVNANDMKAANERIDALAEKTRKYDDLIEKLTGRIEKLETENKAKDVEIQRLKDNQSTTNHGAWSADIWSKLPKSATNAISIVANKENIEVSKKELNLIVFGVKESDGEATNKNEEDKTAVNKIMESIGQNWFQRQNHTLQI